MTWLIVITVTIAFAAFMVVLARDVLRILREADLLYERAEAGECTCTRHRLCAVCLAELRGEQAA